MCICCDICIGRYVGDSAGNVSVLKIDLEPCQIVKMKYTIPLSASHGKIHSRDIFYLYSNIFACFFFEGFSLS